MISVDNAIQILEKQVFSHSAIGMHVSESLGLILAKDILSPIAQPSFNQSAMDGYAFSFQEGRMDYTIVGEIAAGSGLNPKLKLGEGVRIFTGAMVPSDANIVVQQEWIERVGDKASILNPVKAGKNIRFEGEQIKKGEIALEKGSLITPATIGFLLGIGVVDIEVYQKPSVTILTTGNELVKAGEALTPGQIYESNSGMLSAVLNVYGITKQQYRTVSDNYEETKNQIRKALDNSDVLILTGGISVGDYDFVGLVLKELQVEELFYKINQKPGKPIYMGRYNNVLIAALPGNPAAALTCFYMYVLPCLNRIAGKPFSGLEKMDLPLKDQYVKKGNKSLFLKGKITEGIVEILEMQSSAMLRTFAKANAIIYFPEKETVLEKGSLVKVYKI